MKSDTCFSKKTALPLSYYFNEFEAKIAADYSNDVYGNDLIPYECKKCGFWHLSPKFRITPSKKCKKCTAGDGTYKNTYRTKREANVRADIIYGEQDIDLKVYKCRYEGGWHLTKRF
jgi:hypothetical protein